MMEDNQNKRWSKLDELEDKALGMFVGGMLLDTDADALSKEPVALPPLDLSEVEALLQSIGVRRATPRKAETVAEMKQQIVFILETNAQVASIAARNFESFPDEAVKTIYEELLELQQKSNRKG